MTSNFSNRAISLPFRILFTAAAAVVAVSVLFAMMVLLLASVLWSLLRGRKAAPIVLWQRYRQASAQARRAASRMATRRSGPVDDVVDVQAREVGPLAPQRIQGQ